MVTWHETASWETWRFVRGETAFKDFQAWVFSDPNNERAFGQAFYFDLISADHRDRYVVYDLKKCLFEWALALSPLECPFFGYVHKHSITFEEMTRFDLGNGSFRRLLPIGFWHSDTAPNLPHPRDYVDPEWDQAERDRVMEYLEGAYIAGGALGFSWCRMGCGSLNMGHRDLTDGTWLFPEGFAHYVLHHSLKPDPAFLDHVRRNGYLLPKLSVRRLPCQKTP